MTSQNIPCLFQLGRRERERGVYVSDTCHTRLMTPGLGCTTTSQIDHPPRLYLMGSNWRPWHLKIKTVTIPKGGWHGRSCHPIWEVSQCIWAELQEAGGLSVTLAVNGLGRCRASRPRLLTAVRVTASLTHWPVKGFSQWAASFFVSDFRND